MRTLGRLLAHGPRHWRPQTSSREIFILLAYLRGIQYTSFSYYFRVPIYRAVKEVWTDGYIARFGVVCTPKSDEA